MLVIASPSALDGLYLLSIENRDEQPMRAHERPVLPDNHQIHRVPFSQLSSKTDSLWTAYQQQSRNPTPRVSHCNLAIRQQYLNTEGPNHRAGAYKGRLRRDSNSRRELPSHAFEACSLDRSDTQPWSLPDIAEQQLFYYATESLPGKRRGAASGRSEQPGGHSVRRARMACARSASWSSGG